MRMRSIMMPRLRMSSEPGSTLAGRQSGTSSRSTGGPGGNGLGRRSLCSPQSEPTVKPPRGAPESVALTVAGEEAGRRPTPAVSASSAPGVAPGR